MKYSIIPSEREIERALLLSKECGVCFEYNEFWLSKVYDDPAETQRLIDFYKSFGRDMSQDTIHGAFLGLDIAAADSTLRNRSRALFEYSMQTAQKLGVKGVVFHTGLIGELRIKSYTENWLNQTAAFIRNLAERYPMIEIYLENTFEQEPDMLLAAAKALADVPNFGLCLDYAHAILTKTPIETWCSTLAPYIRHMHINDNDLKADLHLVPGDGVMDFAQWKHLMQKYGIDVRILVELNGVENGKRGADYLENIAPAEPAAVNDSNLRKILDIGIALSREKDTDKLFGLIVDTAMEMTQSDGGTLYILRDDTLQFRIMKTRSKGIDLGSHGEKINIPAVPLRRDHICSFAAITGRSLNIPDVYLSDEFDFSGPKRYDSMNNYHTQSMVAIPLIDQENVTIGVLQLINAADNGVIRPFTKEEEYIITSLASQTAIAISNMRYMRELTEQMWSFTEAMTEAIDARTPYNASHTRKVAEYSGMIADVINQKHEAGLDNDYFPADRRDQLVMAAFLHDIGKLVIPTEVMNKETRLGDKYDVVMQRLKDIGYQSEIAFLKKELSDEAYREITERLNQSTELVKQANTIGFLNDGLYESLQEVFGYEYTAPDGSCTPFFTEDEKISLCIRKGTLTQEERQIMESHVVMTDRILNKVHFNRLFRDAKIWAAQHHERINGTGYPNKISGTEIGLEARILAVADVYDALIATDRPYKRPIPKEKAFAILRSMANEGQMDGYLVDYLEEALSE